MGNEFYLAKLLDNDVYYYHNDPLGSPIIITDEDGNTVKEYDYYAFGGIRNESGSFSNTHKFTGKELDESGLYYFGARYMDNAIGRFIRPDPSGKFEKGDPQTLNPYVYCTNNPLYYRDPNGKFRVYAFRDWNEPGPSKYTYQLVFTNILNEAAKEVLELAEPMTIGTRVGKALHTLKQIVKWSGILKVSRTGAGRLTSPYNPIAEAKLAWREGITDPKARKLSVEMFGKDKVTITREEAEAFLEEVKKIKGAENLYDYKNILNEAESDAESSWWNRFWEWALDKE